MGGRPKHPREFDRRFWAGVRAGLSVEAAAGTAGMSVTWARDTFRKAGGVNPIRIAGPIGRYLSWLEREEIAALDHEGHGVCEIARRLDRSAGTISRELDRGATSRGYRASVGQARADSGRTGPRRAKLATNLPLREEVQSALKRRESPEQIAGRLKIDFPDDLEMRVSAETIYQSLYVQARGGLKRELTRYLRTGRSMRKPRRLEGERRGRIPGMVMISERPPEVEDRAVAGHWGAT
jgi:IS30 family transposase